MFKLEQLGELQGDPIYLSILYEIAQYLYHLNKLSIGNHKDNETLSGNYAEQVYRSLKHETK